MKFSNLFRQSEDGASLTPYALIVGLIAITAITAIGDIGTFTTSLFEKTSTSMETAAGESTSSGASESLDTNGIPLCSEVSSPISGDLCDFETDENTVIYVGNTQAGASQTPTPFYAARCDLGQIYDENTSVCVCDASTIVESGNNVQRLGHDVEADNICSYNDGTNGNSYDRSNYPWNDGSSNWLDTDLSDVSCGATTCTDDNSDGQQAWDTSWDGLSNTTFLISVDSADDDNDGNPATGNPNNDAHEAAEACAALGSGWYLPAINELTLIYSLRNTGDFVGSIDDTDSFPHGNYWSSSEERAQVSEDHTIANGGPDKNNGITVRCAHR